MIQIFIAFYNSENDTGFHRVLQSTLNLSFDASSVSLNNCTLVVVEFIPAGAFADVDELKVRNINSG